MKDKDLSKIFTIKKPLPEPGKEIKIFTQL